jgi:hypothetical protein
MNVSETWQEGIGIGFSSHVRTGLDSASSYIVRSSFQGASHALYEAFRLVAMAEGNHAYPSRTRPLSPPAPMVLGPQGPGRVGRRQAGFTISTNGETTAGEKAGKTGVHAK